VQFNGFPIAELQPPPLNRGYCESIFVAVVWIGKRVSVGSADVGTVSIETVGVVVHWLLVLLRNMNKMPMRRANTSPNTMPMNPLKIDFNMIVYCKLKDTPTP